MVDSIIIVVGIPGSGKSSALEGVEAETGAVVISVGTEMAKKGGVADRDTLRKEADAEEKAAVLRRRVLEDALDSDAKTIILDTHAVVKTSSGYMEGFSEDDMKMLEGKVKAVIYVHADAPEIIKRRQKDAGRQRDGETEPEVEAQQRMSEDLCLKISARLGAKLYGIDGTKASKEEVRDEMRSIIKEAIGTDKRRAKTHA